MKNSKWSYSLVTSLRTIGVMALIGLNMSCGGGSGAVDDFIGGEDGNDGDGVKYSLDLDPSSYNFGPLKTTAASALSKTVTVKNNSSTTLYVTTVSGTTSADFTLTSETCSTAGGLAPAATCDFTVEFKPQTSGAKSYLVALAFGTTAGAIDNKASGSFTGVGEAPAQLLISDGPQYDFGDVVINGGVGEKSFGVTNIGDYPASAITPTAPAAPFAFKGGSFPGTGGTCGTTLAKGATCYIAVTFSPTAAGGHTANLVLDYNDSDTNRTATRAMTGTGKTAANLTMSDANHDYGSLAIGTNADFTYTVTNTGGVRARTMTGGGLAAPFTFKGGTYPGTGGTCAAQLLPLGTCTLVVNFAPTTTGLKTDDIEIGYDDGLNAQTLANPIQGTGVTPANISISGAPTYDFGTQVAGSVTDGTLTLSNIGGFTASSMNGAVAAAPFSFKGGSYPGTGGTCTNTLAPAATCTVVLVYSPTVAGVQNSTFTSSYNNGVVNATSVRAVRGTATSPANLSISGGTTYNYGTKAIGSATDATFTITNSGGSSALTVAGAGLAVPFDFKGAAFPGTGGTCTSTIAAASTCTIVVTYSPVAAGTFNDEIEVNYTTGSLALTAKRPVTGVGVTAAVLTISESDPYDFGNVPANKSVDKTFTITNGGGFAASAISGSGLAAPYTFKGGSFPGTGGTCAATLNPAATCTFVVNFISAATGTLTDTIDIAYNNGVSGQTVSRGLTATSVSPANITITDGPIYDYGSVAVGATNEKTFTLGNAGAFSATAMSGSGLAAPFRFKGGTYPGTGGTCGTTLAPAATCDIVVTYSPTTIAAHSDTIDINYNNGTAVTVSSRGVQGLGTTPAALTISNTPSYDFGNQPVGIVVSAPLTVTNTGGVPSNSMTGAGLTAPFQYVGGAYPGTGGTCAATLNPAASCTIIVEFNPTAVGTYTKPATISYNTTVINTSTSRNVTGKGVAPALLTLNSAPQYDFGIVAVGASKSGTLTVTNSGSFVASSLSGSGLAAPYEFQGGAFPGTAGNCGATLNVGASCTISITVSPLATGTPIDTVEVNYSNGVAAQTATRDLTTTAASPAAITISDGPLYPYGTKAVGSATDKTFTLQNTGGVSATSLAGSGLAAPFAFKGGSFPGTGGNCLGTLLAGASCNIVVTYAPTAVGSFTDTIEMSFNNGVSVQTSYRDLSGTAVTAALLNISDSPLYNYGTVVAGTSNDHTFTIDNSGQTDATSMGVGAALAAPFTYKGGSYPGTGGTCGPSLVSLGTCTIVVNYTPPSNGAKSAVINIAYNNGTSTTQNVTRNIQGVAAPAGVLTISNAPSYNFGTVANTSVTEKTFTVTNTGGVTVTGTVATGLTAPFNFKGGSYPGTAGTCGATLLAATSCTMVIEFSPTVVSGYSNTLTLTYNNGATTQTSTRAMSGTAVAPALLNISFSPEYDFGVVATNGGFRETTFTVTNNGNYTASALGGSNLSAPYSFKGGSFPGVGGNCGTNLNANTSCTFVVRFEPGTTGTLNGEIHVDYNNGASVQAALRAVTGTGAVPALLTISDGPTYDFGTYASGGSGDKSFIVTNTGGVTATALAGTGLSAPYSFKGGSYPGTGGTCSTTLASTATCTVVLTFNPTAVGVFTKTLAINYNDGTPTAANVTRDLTGTGVTPGNLTISETGTYNFGTKATGSTTDKVFTVSNTGSFATSAIVATGLTAPFTFKGGSYPGSGGNCVTGLAAGASCTVVVTYAPTANGTLSRTLNLAYNNGATTQNTTRPMTGTGAAPANLAISDGVTYNYGTKATGSFTTKLFTITNSGGVPATTVNGAGLSAPFTFEGGSYPGTSGTCGVTLVAGANCQVAVVYAPTATGVQTAQLDVTYDNGVTGITVSRGMTGTGASPALISVSDGPIYNHGIVAIGNVSEKTYTLTNSGGFPATSITGSGLAAPFNFKGGTYPGTGGTCTATLNATSTCTVVIRFTPTSSAVFNATVDFAYNDGAFPQTASRDMEGEGVTPANLTISDAPNFDYGNVVRLTTLNKTFTISNSGALSADSVAVTGLAAPFAFAGGTYPGTGGNCGTSIASSASCTIVVTFAPTVAGARSATMSVNYNNQVATVSSTRPIQGTGVLPASLVISNASVFAFGARAQGSTNDGTLTITNSGGFQATLMTGGNLSAPYSFKDGSFPGTGATCTTTLASGATCTIVITYAPTTIATHTGTMQIGYFDGIATQTSTRNVSGNGVAPGNLIIGEVNYDYGIVATGGEKDRTFTITNNGSFLASSVGGSGLATPFAFKGGTFPGTGGTCGTTVAAGATCRFVVTYAPIATGVQADQAVIGYFDGANPKTTTTDLTGTGADPALLTISDAPTYNFGTFANGGTGEKTFTIANVGGVPATSVAGSGIAAPFTFKGGAFPGTGGTCAATLAAAANCTMVVNYKPTAVGTHTGTILINYINGVGAATPSDRAITGTAVAPASLSISESGTYDFGTRAIGSVTEKIFTITNTGSFGASSVGGSGLTAPYEFKGSSYPGLGGDCTTTLAAGASCNVVVTFAPTVVGTNTKTMSIAYNNGATAQTATRPMQGVGATPANITISDGGTYNYGTKATGSVTLKTFTITNAGGVPATTLVGAGLVAPFDFEGGAYPGTNGNCSNSLAAAATCTISVAFSPTATGLQNSTITFTYNNGVNSGIVSNRAVQGTGATPAFLAISDSPTYSFGDIGNGGSAEKTFTVTNSGGVRTESLTGTGISPPFAFKGGSFPGTGGTCSANLASLATCTIVINFAPTANGTFTNTLAIAYNDGVVLQNVTRDMTGNGVPPALLTISETGTYNYGSVVTGTTLDKTFTVTNSGNLQATALTSLALTAPFTYPGGAFPGSGGTCAATLNIGASCTLIVRFSPTTTVTSSQTITLNYTNGVVATNTTRPITGTGTTPANLTISNSPTFSFGTIANTGTADGTLTISNTGGFQATSVSGSAFSAPYSYKDGTYPGTGGTCGTTIATGATCTVVLNYSPTVVGTQTATLTMSYQNGSATPSASVARNLTGTAVTPANLSITGTTLPYDYLTVATGGYSDKTFTITNGGQFPATALAGSGLTAPFAFAGAGTFPGGGNCGATLNAGASCTMIIRYAPVTTGFQSNTFTVAYNNGASAQVLNGNIQGTGANPALLTVSDASLYNYGTLANGGTADHSFTITNSGGVPATAMSGAGLAAPYSFKGGTYPGTGGTCAASLAISTTCTVVVNYSPTTIGTHNITLNIPYTDGVGSQTATRDITGTAVAPALLAISDGPTYDYGTRANGSVTDKTFTVTNNGSFLATTVNGVAIAAPFAYKGGNYPGTGGDCSASIAPAATCLIVVSFAPTSSGLNTRNITLSYNNGASAQTSLRAVQGTGATPASLTVSDGPTYDYGTRATGSATDKTLTITNGGAFTASAVSFAALAAPFDWKDGVFPGTGGSCSTSLTGGATCTVVVTYSPTGTGLNTHTLSLSYNDGVTTQNSTRDLRGTGAAPASLSISDGPTYDFGAIAVTGSAEKTLTISNSGGVEATSIAGSGLSAPYSFKGGTFPGTAGTCTTILAAGANCTVIAVFAPTGPGVANATINVTYVNGVNAQATTRNVTGSGVTPANLVISETGTYNYGNVVQNTSVDKTFTVTNSGSLQASAITQGAALSAPFSFKGGSFPGTGGNCPATLASSGTCLIVVTYAPTAITSSSSTISISYNNTLGTVTSTRPVQGTGVTPASLTISNSPTFNFGTIANNGVIDGTVTITNGGGYQATSVVGSNLTAPFEFKDGTFPGTGGTCTGTIAPAATCTVVMTFSPTTIATHNNTLQIDYFSGAANVNTTRNVRGISVAPANLTVSDATTYDYGTVATGGYKDKTFTISNSGDVSATGIGGSGITAPFTFPGGSFPGTGGNCTTTLASGATCTMVIRYSPVSTGLQSTTVTVGYNDGAQARTTTRPMQGTGAAPATLAISDGLTFDFGTRANGSTTDKTFTITNSGGVPATGLAGSGATAPYSFKGGTFPGTGGSCLTSLAAASQCTMVVSYAPTSNTTHNATITVTYDDGVAAGNTVTRPVTGTAVSAASLVISDAGFDFGTKANGSVTEKTFTVTNAGNFAASSVVGSGLSAPFLFKGGTYPGSGGTCATSIAGASTCTMVVTFSPTVTNSYNATMLLTYNNGALPGQTSNRPITGASAAPATITISDVGFDFGTRATGSSTDKTFTITNGGGVPATGLGATGLSAPFTFKGSTYPGTGGTCAATLNAANTCTIVVTYAPTGTGLHLATMDVNFDDGVTTQTSSRAMQGTGAAPASLSISDGPGTYSFGNVAVGATPSKTFTITNGGGVAATSLTSTGLSAPFSVKGGTFPGTGGTCTATLNASATCTVVVEFAPSGTGPVSNTLAITYNNGVAGGQSATRGVSGTGVAPALLEISDATTYNYGNVVVSTSTDKVFTVTNTGSIAATTISGSGLSAPFTFKDGSFPGTGGDCSPTTLAPAATCTIVVTYSPTAAVTSNGTITLGYNNGVSAQTSTRPVTGTGVTAALLVISNATTFSFGSIANNGTVDATLTVTNNGGFAATSVTGSGLAAPFTFRGGGAFPGTAGTCTATLAPAASCTVTLTFSPTSLGTHNRTLSVDYNNGISNQSSTRPLTGTAVAPALLTVSDGPTFDYGTIANGGTTNKTFTITNSGAVSATAIAGVGLGAPFTYAGGTFPGGGTCSTTLASGGTCTFVVTYAPTATGVQSNSFTINYNDGAQPRTATGAVQGTGANPALLSISDAGFDFGTRAQGSTTDKTFTITNTGGVSATAMSGSGLSAPYTFKTGTYPGTGGTCATSVAAGATCTVVVTYNPTTVATHNATMSIDYNNGVNAQSATRAITGTAVSAANLVISDATTYNFGTQANGSSTDKTFTITNSGSFTASINTTTAGLAAPYTFKGGGNFPGSGGTCSATLAGSNATCTFIVTFAPVSTGSYTDSVDVTYNNGAAAGQTSSRGITGASAAPASITISDSSPYNFGTRATGSSTDKTFTITNGGGVVAASLVINGLSAPYTFKGGSFPGTGGDCSTSLPAGNSCSVVVTYAPSATGVQNASLDVAYNDGVTAQNISRTMTGTGANPASLTISDVGYDYGTIAIGAAPEKTFTVTNGGGVPATTIAGSGLAAPFTFKGGSFPGTGGTCTATLNATLTCTMVVVYTPTAAVTSNGTITLTFNNGVVGGQTSTRAIQGTGVTPAVLTISDTNPYNYGNVVQTGFANKTFTITNTGSLGATAINGTGLAAPFAFAGGSFPGSGGDCTATLAPAATCLVVVRYSPTTLGAHSGTLDMGYNNGVSAQTTSKTLQGTGATPASMTFSGASPFPFGTIANNGTVDGTLTITNAGGVPATSLTATGLAAPFSYKGGGAFPGTGGTCTGTLASGASCTIAMTYSPTSIGTQNATLSVDFNNGLNATSNTRNVTGTAVAPASLTISDSGYNYGTVATGGTASKTFTITNGGAVSATGIGSTGLGGAFNFVGAVYPGGGTCSTTLAASATCTVIVAFSPSATGAQNATMNINYNDGAQAQSTSRLMSGTGAAPAVLTVSDAGFDFGPIANGGSAEKTFTITNSGGVPATAIAGSGLSTPYTFKGGTFPGTGGSCTATLAAATTCTTVVTFAPTTLGVLNATMSIAYNDGVSAATPATRAITGTGVNPAIITISETGTYNFGAVATTATLNKTFTITNTGNITATSLTGTGLSAPFSFSGGSYPGDAGDCSISLAPGATCLIDVRFAPTVVTTSNSTINIGYNNGVAAGQSSTRPVQGSGVTAASLSISDGATFDFGNVAQNGAVDKTFTITNGGGATATLVTGSALSAPYGYKGGGAFPGTGGTCTTSLVGAGTCTYVVTFSPTTIASGQNATVTVTYTNGVTAGQTTNRAMTGAGVAPANLSISGASPYDFGTIANGASAETTLTVTNGGAVTATSISGTGLSSPFAFKGGSYPGTGGTCTTSLNSGATCTVVFTYIPVGTGTSNGTATLNYNDGSGPVSVNKNLTGTAVGPAVLTISDTGYNYGSVATTGFALKSFTITNAGGIQATSMTGTGISAPYTFNGGTYPGTGGGDCGTTLAPAATCVIVVRFAPTVTGTHNATINMTYNNGVSPGQSSTRAVTGTGALPASIAISDTNPYDYGNVVTNGSADHAFTLTNSGGLTATSLSASGLSGMFNYKGGLYPGTGGSCGTTLNGAGATCTIVVTYAPTTSVSHNSILNISYYDGAVTQTPSRTMQGVGSSPALLTVSDATTFSFGSVANGSINDKTFTVTNSGGVAALTMTGSGLSAPYGYKGGSFPGTGGTCTATLAAGASCTFLVTYSPTTAATHNGTLSVDYNNGLSAQSATRPMTGTATNPAILTISDVGYDFGNVYNNLTAEKTFTVTNSGDYAASAVAGSGLAAPYSYKGGSFPGTGGNCTAALGIGSSCTFVAVFAPTVAGVQTGTANVAYNNGASVQNATRLMTGTGITPDPPTMPGSPMAVVTVASRLDISWTASTGTAPITYDVLRSTVSGGTFTAVSSGQSAVTFNDTGVTAGTQYYYKIRVNGPGGTLTTSEFLGRPIQSFIISSVVAGNLSAAVTWPAVAGATSYNVKWGTTSGAWPSSATNVTSPYTITGLTPGIDYFVQVTAVNVNGQLDATSEETVKPYSQAVAFATNTAADANCAVMSNGELRCWGRASYGMIGNGAEPIRGDDPEETGDGMAFAKLGTGLTVTQVAPSRNQSWGCALMNNQRIKCWGINSWGNLGYGDTVTRGTSAATSGDNLPFVDIGGNGTVLAQKVVTTSYNACALTTDGYVKCWGYGNDGQNGNNGTASKGDGPNEMGNFLIPVDFGVRYAVDITAGDRHVCALLDDASVRCWGSNGNGQLGIGNTTNMGTNSTTTRVQLLTGVNVGTGRTVTQVSALNNATCVLLNGNTDIKCWGANTVGQLGQGNSSGSTPNNIIGDDPAEMGNNLIVTPITGGTVAQLSAGGAHVCVRFTSGAVKCWGQGNDGKLGIGNSNDIGDTAGEVAAIANIDLGTAPTKTATYIVAGNRNTCATLNDGSVKCWGIDQYGQLGKGGVGNLATIGDNGGEMGNALVAAAYPTTPTANPTLAAFPGNDMICYMMTNGGLVCDGNNIYGQLGIGQPAHVGDDPDEMGAFLTKVDLGTGLTAKKVAMGAAHTCVILSNDGVKCFGRNNIGQLGYADTTNRGSDPSDMGDTLPFVNLNGRTAKEISLGQYHTCVILNDDSTRCWGRNNEGQLGKDSTTAYGNLPGQMGSNLPSINVGSGRYATALSTGYNHTCVILDNKTVKCWGQGNVGQIGQGGTTNWGNTPTTYNMANLNPIPIGANVTAISSGSHFNCVTLETTNALRCWGQNNYGQLGINNTNDMGDAGGEVAGLSNINLGAGRSVINVSLGTHHSCAVLDNNTAKCWGRGDNGRLGQGSSSHWGSNGTTLAMASLPIINASGSLMTKISAGNTHTCILSTTGLVKCWGANAYGQLGIGSTTQIGTSTAHMTALATTFLYDASH